MVIAAVIFYYLFGLWQNYCMAPNTI